MVINWRQIVLHLIATWLIMFACYKFSFLFFIPLIKDIRQSGVNIALHHLTETDVSVLTYFTLATGFSPIIGLLIAFIISLAITIKRRWYWVNPVIVLLVGYLLSRFELPGGVLSHIFSYLPPEFQDYIMIQFLGMGLIFLSGGLVIFFLKKINQFIEQGNQWQKPSNNIS